MGIGMYLSVCPSLSCAVAWRTVYIITEQRMVTRLASCLAWYAEILSCLMRSAIRRAVSLQQAQMGLVAWGEPR